MEEHLIIFIDILGFSNAISNRDDSKLTALVQLLRNLAAQRAEFDFTETRQENGAKFTLIPAISTFSDLIVMSIPVEQLQRMGGKDLFSIGLTMLEPRIGTLAAEAIRHGLLIRGGATVGPLHHRQGVVMGQAMIDAYDLESHVAIYPRIVVSRKVCSTVKMKWQSSLEFLPKDLDGVTHLNYFRSMFMAALKVSNVGPAEQLNAWYAMACSISDENITKFESDEKWNQLAKWTWFKSQLEKTRAGLNPFLFDMEKQAAISKT